MADAPLRPRAHLHHDPRALEAAFLAALDRALAARRGRLPRIAVVAPTRRLADRLAVVATDARGALAGVQFFVHRGLARHLLAEAGLAAPRELPAPLLAALIRRRIARAGSPLAAYLADHASGIAPLLATFRDLRDARIAAEEAAKARALSRTASDTLALYAEFEALLGALEAAELGDSASAPRRACDELARAAPPFDALLHHGAYDLIGTHRELIATLAQRVPTELFVPAVAGHELPLALV